MVAVNEGGHYTTDFTYLRLVSAVTIPLSIFAVVQHQDGYPLRHCQDFSGCQKLRPCTTVYPRNSVWAVRCFESIAIVDERDCNDSTTPTVRYSGPFRVACDS